MLGDAPQNVGEPGLRIDVVHLGRLCRQTGIHGPDGITKPVI
jgi:hypothetical protein